MKNAENLRKELCEVFDSLKTGSLPPKQAREMIKPTSTQIALAKIELEYAAACGRTPIIKFLDCK